MMNLLTITRRADFGDSLNSLFSNARARLRSGASYFKMVESSLTLDKMQREFHESTYLTGLVSIAEALLTDMATEFLVRYPGHIKDKNLPLDALATLGSVGAVVESLAAKTINDWSYGRFSELARQVILLYDKKASLDSAILDDVSELKATRDLFVHGGGEVNNIYLSKAGIKARSGRLGSRLELGSKYLAHADMTIGQFVAGLETMVPDDMKRMGKASTFRAMWEATVLSEFVSFDTGWVTENENMVRPNDQGLKWGWSGSEKMLLDFFLGIYNEEYPSREHDAMSALRRWSPTTNEGKVIMSWFDSPFWF
ncbi:MAG: hypothetical protein HP491_17870 [Nitrospira sp.]|nr:hypothetical protein [Nitrospira sp.]MBH0183767.1 hypothetical protein [Nitrospira sp.]